MENETTLTLTLEDIDCLDEGLEQLERFWLDLLNENPPECSPSEARLNISKIRKLSSDFLGTLNDSVLNSSPVIVKVKVVQS